MCQKIITGLVPERRIIAGWQRTVAAATRADGNEDREVIHTMYPGPIDVRQDGGSLLPVGS